MATAVRTSNILHQLLQPYLYELSRLFARHEGVWESVGIVPLILTSKLNGLE